MSDSNDSHWEERTIRVPSDSGCKWTGVWRVPDKVYALEYLKLNILLDSELEHMK